MNVKPLQAALPLQRLQQAPTDRAERDDATDCQQPCVAFSVQFVRHKSIKCGVWHVAGAGGATLISKTTDVCPGPLPTIDVRGGSTSAAVSV